MVHFYLLYFFIVLLQKRGDSSDKPLFNRVQRGNIDLHCRDNKNMPVDWWMIYKPPRDTGPYFESGINFTYITSLTAGRWQPSRKFINSDSMLQYTLAPMYEHMYKRRLGVISYGEQSFPAPDDDLHPEKSGSYGVMFANSVSGIWIGHTVPGFPNLSRYPPTFPDEELSKGHMIMCLAVDLSTLNAITAIVRHTQPNILKFTLPDKLVSFLPEWTLIETAVSASNDAKTTKTKLFNFMTRNKTLRGAMLARSPEDSRCLYSTFAKLQGIVIDVYSNSLYKNHPVCEEAYSLRHIDSISLKFPDQQVYYVNNKTDRMSFAVSTAAVWQRTGQNTPHFWTCAGNIHQQTPITTPAKGGLIACINHYYIWLTFDNLKVKEPEC